MWSSLNRRLIAFAKAKAQPVRCKRCGNTFNPFADQEIVSWGDMIGASTCPKCGTQVESMGARSSDPEHRPAPDAPFRRPKDSRIERHEISASKFIYHIPATGKGGFILVFSILWNGFLLFFAWVWLFAAEAEPKNDPAFPFAIFLVPFVAVGVGMGYAALRAKYAVHLLFVGPELIRLQRQLFGRRTNRDLPTPEITSIGQTVFYTQNYRPVYGIEIAARQRKLRFGSALPDEDKRWLCAELREYLRSTGHSSASRSAPSNSAADRANTGVTSVDIRTAVGTDRLTRAIVEYQGHDSLIIQIPPSGRWGASFTIALILTCTLASGCVFLFAGMEPGFDTIRRLRPGAEWFIALGMLLTTLFAALAWYSALRYRYLQQRVSVDRDQLRLETEVFGKKPDRSLSIREINRVELLEVMKMNEQPRHAVRVVSPKQSFWFGSTLPEEDKPAVAALLREFLHR